MQMMAHMAPEVKNSFGWGKKEWNKARNFRFLVAAAPPVRAEPRGVCPSQQSPSARITEI
jgi:hypothetical protein